MVTDNYQGVIAHDKKRFRQRNPEEMAANTHLQIEKGQIIVAHFGQIYRVAVTSGDITAADGEKEVSTLTQMLILHHLLEAKPSAKLSNEFVTIAALKDACVHQKAFENRELKPLARYFNGRLGDFRRVGEVLQGQKSHDGDCAFILRAFPMFPLKIIFWDGEEEMPAAVNILFDGSATDFTHPEDVIGLGGAAAQLILETAQNFH